MNGHVNGGWHPRLETRRAPRALYGLLFRSAWAALRDLAADPRHLGADIGALLVLHTWRRQLQLAVSMLKVAGSAPVSASSYPSCPLAAAFRNRFMSGLEALLRNDKVLPPDLAASPSVYDQASTTRG